MKPRSLRHSLEKAAKLLVLIQKHVPDVECSHDELKGTDGQLMLDFAASGNSRPQMVALGKDLENRGYQFTEKRVPGWARSPIWARRPTNPPWS